MVLKLVALLAFVYHHVSALIIYEDDSPAIFYGTNWKIDDSAGNSAGHAHRADIPNSSASIWFNGVLHCNWNKLYNCILTFFVD